MRDGGGGCDNPLHVAVASKPWTTLLLAVPHRVEAIAAFFFQKNQCKFWNSKLEFDFYLVHHEITSHILSKEVERRRKRRRRGREEERKRGREEERKKDRLYTTIVL